MFGTIIIGVDGRQGGRDALALGAALAEASGGDLVAASAFPVENYPGRAAIPAFRQVLIEETRKLLAAELEATGVDARPVPVQDTSPARGLHRAAEHEHAGLIVIGAPSHGPIGRMLLGDVTHGTLSSAPCAVAVAPKGFARRGLRTIGVGFDGTPEAQRALELAADLARETGARLEIVTSVETPQAISTYKAYLDIPQMRARAMEHAERTLADAMSGLGVERVGEVVDESPATALIELSRRVDLVVLGSRNWGPVRRLMVGSTAHAVVGHAECAVLVLPRGAHVEEPVEPIEAAEAAQPTLVALMSAAPFRVVVAGGGVAGLEALLTLHALAGERCELTLLDPEPAFVYRPLAVAEPFLLGDARRYPLDAVARDVGARLVAAGLAAVDDGARTVTTSGGETVPYDALIVATGARSMPAYEHALNWDERAGNEQLRGLLADVEEGYSRRLAFVIPPGPGWPLPAYELALLTAGQARGMQMTPEITLVSPEPAPLAVFGTRASDAVAADLAAAGVRFEGGVRAEVERGRAVTVVLHPRDERLEVDRVIALPRLAGRAVDGVPGDADGFVPVDAHARVRGLERVWAAGDGIDFPVKFGGLATEQADAAAEAIAALAGADVTPAPFRPVLRGRLMTGRRDTRFLHHVAGGGGGEGTTAEHALWWPPGKIAGRRLSPYLAERDEAATAGDTQRPAGLAVQADLVRELGIPT